MKRYIKTNAVLNDRIYKYYEVDYEATDNQTGLEEYGGNTALCAKSKKEAVDFMKKWAKDRNITYTELNLEPISHKDIPPAWDIIVAKN